MPEVRLRGVHALKAEVSPPTSRSSSSPHAATEGPGRGLRARRGRHITKPIKRGGAQGARAHASRVANQCQELERLVQGAHRAARGDTHPAIRRLGPPWEEARERRGRQPGDAPVAVRQADPQGAATKPQGLRDDAARGPPARRRQAGVPAEICARRRSSRRPKGERQAPSADGADIIGEHDDPLLKLAGRSRSPTTSAGTARATPRA